ncbi:unnamed protein product [Arctogadus glacialis]
MVNNTAAHIKDLPLLEHHYLPSSSDPVAQQAQPTVLHSTAKEHCSVGLLHRAGLFLVCPHWKHPSNASGVNHSATLNPAAPTSAEQRCVSVKSARFHRTKPLPWLWSGRHLSTIPPPTLSLSLNSDTQ